MTRVTVAAVQAEPVILDAKSTLGKVVDLIGEATRGGAGIVVFPETFIPGYAQWTHSAAFEDDAAKRAYARLARESVRVPEDLGPVADAARRHGITVVLPVTERVDTQPGTLYNTFVVFAPDGTYKGKHRKLVPTHHERTAYGYGGGDTLRVFDAGGVRFGGLLCWNNFMPVARYALYRQGLHVWLAPTADDLPNWQTAMRYIAREARAYVVAPCLLQRKSSFPADWELADDPAWQQENEWNERGGTCIVGPDGEYLAEPVYEKETILYAEVDTDRVVAERQTFDAAGHYARDEVFDVRVRGLDATSPGAERL